MALQYPHIVEFLSIAVYEDGGKRQPGTAMLIVEDAVWKLWLHDRDVGESAWVTEDTLTAVLAAAEDGLKEESLQWRRAKPAPGGGGKKY